jgi:6-phosphofructokinase 1
MPIGGKKLDMTDAIKEVYDNHHLDCLICLGGGGTQKNAYRLHEKGMNIITLPKTIDNDVCGTDITFGFDTAMTIATEAVDRLHSTAHSHYRIIVVEIMGHNTGWLALSAGTAGGADVILIPEIPYDVDKVAESILERRRMGKDFSIVAVSEGAMSKAVYDQKQSLKAKKAKAKKDKDKKAKKQAKQALKEIEEMASESTTHLARQLEEMTLLEARVTILGHVQRGGTPSPLDRLLATRLGAAAAKLVDEERYGVMVAIRGDGTEAVPLEEVVGNRKNVPLDHPWIQAARDVGTSLGD